MTTTQRITPEPDPRGEPWRKPAHRHFGDDAVDQLANIVDELKAELERVKAERDDARIWLDKANLRALQAEKQRDELLAALKLITTQTNDKYQFCEPLPMIKAHQNWRNCIDKAKTAIANAERKDK